MPSAQDVYITPASSKIQIYSGSAMNGLISGNTHLYVSGSSDLLLKASDDIYLSTYGSSGIIVFETDSAESGRWLEDKGLRITQGTPGTTTDALYNVGGSLYFNGSEVGGGGGGTFAGSLSDNYIPIGTAADTIGNFVLGLAENNSIWIGSDPTSTTNTAEKNTALGSTALDAITTGDRNVAIGYNALSDLNGGNDNTAIGTRALASITDGAQNTVVGVSGAYLMNGNYNTVIGHNAAANATSMGSSVIIGREASAGSTNTGDDNIFIGVTAGYGNTDADRNIGIGRGALYSNLDGDNNVALGYEALYTMDPASGAGKNIAIGGQAARAVTTGTGNIGIGYRAAYKVTTTNNNIAIGNQAMEDATGAGSVISIGEYSGYNPTGANNIFMGYQAGYGDSTDKDAASNVGIGKAALKAITDGAQNVAIGHQAAEALTTASNVTAVGMGAANDLTTGADSVYIGKTAGQKLTTQNYNVVIGADAMNAATGVADSVAIGRQAMGGAAATGDKNVAVGYQAGYDTTTGYENISIGYKAGENVTTANRNIFIGVEAGSGFTTSSEFNVVIGSGSMSTNTQTGNHNVVILGGIAAKADLAETTIVGHLAGGGVSGSQCTFIGKSAGQSTNSGNDLTAIGHGTMRTITGSYNTAIGRGAMGDGAGDAGANLAIGVRSLQALTTGDRNVAIGNYGLAALNAQSDNVTVGDEAGKKINTNNNVMIGSRAGEKLAGGSGGNTHIGAWSGRGDSDLYSGSYNTSVGAYTMNSNSLAAANYNTVVGFEAGKAITGGDNNTLIGVHAGNDLTTGEKNTVLGTWAFASGTSSYNTILGYHAGNAMTSGEENTFVGYHAGKSLTTTNYNVFVGNGAGEFATTTTLSTAVGRQAGGAGVMTGEGNTLLGYRAGYDLTSGHDNTFLGKLAAQNVAGGTSAHRDSVVVGFKALNTFTTNNSHGRFTIVGGEAAYNVASSSSDKNNYTAIGFQAGYNDKSDAQHQLFGSLAGRNLSGSSGEDGCTFVGGNAGYGDALGFIGNDTTGIGRGVFSDDARYSLREVFIGSRAGANYVSGSYNVVIGYDAMRYGGQASLGATENTIVGREAGYNLGRHAAATGSVVIGKGAGVNVSGGSKNVYIGYEAGPSSATATESNKLYINNAGGTPLIGGDFSADTVDIDGDLSTLDSHKLKVVNASSDYWAIYNQSNGKMRIDQGTTQRVLASSGEFQFANDIIVDGEVGIGTTSPQQPLHVLTSANDKGILIDVSDDTHEGRLLFGDTSSNAIGHIGYNHSLNAMRFFTNGSESLRLESDQDAHFYGKLGIGTTPSTALHIAGSGDQRITLGSTSSNSSRLILSSDGGSERIDFSLDGVGNMLAMTETGRIGIGTTSPAAKLHVAGTVEIESTVNYDQVADGTDGTMDTTAHIWNHAPQPRPDGSTTQDGTITLPSSPTAGDTYIIIGNAMSENTIGGSAITMTAKIAGNSNNMNGQSGPLNIASATGGPGNVTYFRLDCVFDGAEWNISKGTPL